MKYMTILFLLLVTVLFADAQRGKDKNPPVVQQPEKPKKDLSNWFVNISDDSVLVNMQFYPAKTFTIRKGKNVYTTKVNALGEAVVEYRAIEIPTDRKARFVKRDEDGTCWFSFTLDPKEKGFVPGDSIIVPYRANGSSDILCYTLNAPTSRAGVAGTVTDSTYQFNGNDFTIMSGVKSDPIKVVISSTNNFVKTVDNPVNALPKQELKQETAPEKKQPVYDPILPPNP